MYKITRDITLDVNTSITQSTITMQQGIADTYRLAIHITKNRQPEDLSECCVQIRAAKPDGTEVVYDSYEVSGNTAYYVVSPQLTAALGNVDCQVEISKSDEILYMPKFQCLITNGLEGTGTYVTPEMYGAVGDNLADDSDALQKAFNDGRDVVFLNNYYVTKTIEIKGKSYLKVYGNNHTIRAESKTPTLSDRSVRYVFLITKCHHISFEDLTIQSSADQDLIAIKVNQLKQPIIYTNHFKSSNIQGFKVQLTDNLLIRNYTSLNLHDDISLQECKNVKIDNWYSNNSLTGFYTSQVKDVSVSNFKIVSDPNNTIEYFHAFYLCHETENVYISNGEAIFENKWENVQNVESMDGGQPAAVAQRTPLFTIHTAENNIRQKHIYVDNVKFTAQRIINVTKMINTPVFSNCIFTTYYPEDALSVHSRGNGQITLSWNTTFNDCIFHLGGRDRGFETSNEAGNDYTILLNDCQLYCTNRSDSNNDQLLLGFYGKFKLTNCFIEWLSFIRRLKIEDVVTEFYNCVINIPQNRAVIRYDEHVTTTTESSIINCFINNGYYTRYETAYQEGKFNIIDSHLVSNNTTWYQGSITGFPLSVKIYNSFLNDKKISTSPDATDSNALATHMVDPNAHANIQLDGNDFD